MRRAMSIKVLDAATVGKIAAGEVVERPSSVAKELIENALDAGATSITVEMRDGGTSYLRITDNGCGIPPEEVRLAFENHATSKLRTGDDLMDIHTLGFRGEALPSIAAVSRVEITTRVKGAPAGVRLRIEGGNVLDVSEAGCPEGTTLIVRDLFFNVPVRRAFLKKSSYEAGVLSDLVTRLMLGNPGVSIRLINNGRTTFHSYGDGNLLHAAMAVYGRETAEHLITLDASEGALRIQGFIGVGECARSTRTQQSFFVNGRLIRCPLLTQALEAVCAGRVTIGTYPICALHVHLPSNAVDVNVHPNKLEIRFRDEAGMRLSAQALLGQAFEGERMLEVCPEPVVSSLSERPKVEVLQPDENEEKTEFSFDPTKVYSKKTEFSFANFPPLPHHANRVLQEGAPAVPMSSVPTQEPVPLFSVAPTPKSVAQTVIGLPKEEKREETSTSDNVEYRLIGVAFRTYVLLEYEDTLVMIDQHAAHERLLYERYQHRLEQGGAAQQLLVPMVIDVSAQEQAILMDNEKLLSEAGFDVEPFGMHAVRVRSVPFVLGQAELSPFFMQMLDQLNRLKGAAEDRRRGDLIQFCCKRAVKAGDKLSEDEIQALLKEMRDTAAPPTCPHGRPILRVLGKGELERMFKRQQ